MSARARGGLSTVGSRGCLSLCARLIHSMLHVANSDARLAMYVGFASAADLEDEQWWTDGFPQELQLRHALQVYRWLEGKHA